MKRPALAGALERGRERLNARFAQAAGRVDPDTFRAHLRDVIEPVIEAVDGVRRDAVDSVLQVAFDVSLTLMAGGLLGREARHPAIVAGWSEVLPRAAWLLAEQPAGIIASVTNALYNLSLQDAARPHVWCRDMAKVAAEVTDLPSFRAAGHVIAWRAGMPQQRESALASCRSLAPKIARIALGVPDADTTAVTAVIDRLAADPWLTPERAFAKPAARALRVVATAGAFRGFGGPFSRPPRVLNGSGGALIAVDRERHWILKADVFGTALFPLPGPVREVRTEARLRLNPDGTVHCGSVSERFEGLAQPTSTAADATTLAATIDQSHQIFLVAMQ